MSPFVRFSLFIITLLWFSGIFLLFLSELWPSLLTYYPAVNMLYSRVCHQIPHKLLHIHNSTTLLCARCTGIYAGAMIGSIIILLNLLKFRISTLVLFLSGLPLIFDVILYSAGFYKYSHYLAFFTGTLFGTIAFFYIFQGLNLLYSELKSGK